MFLGVNSSLLGGAARRRAVLPPSEAVAEAGIDNSRFMTPQGVAQAILAQDMSFKNIAGRNGGLEIWQRGAGGSASIAVAASTTAYTADGWYLKTGTNQACTVSAQAGLTNASQKCARIQRNSAQTGTGAVTFGFPLDVDEVIKAAGNALVLIFTVSTGANWSPANGTLTYNVFFGTAAPVKQVSGYSGQTNPIAGTVNLAQGASAAQTISAVSSAAATGITQGEVQFTFTPSGTAGASDWVSIDDVQLSVVPAGISAVRPAFERTEFLWDLLRCQRHFAKTFVYGTAPAQNAGATGAINLDVNANVTGGILSADWRLPVQARVQGTFTTYSTGNASNNWWSNTNSVNRSFSFLGSGDQVVGIEVTSPVGSERLTIHCACDAGI